MTGKPARRVKSCLVLAQPAGTRICLQTALVNSSGSSCQIRPRTRLLYLLP